MSGPATTKALTSRLDAAALALVLHEDAAGPIAAVPLPASGEVVVVVGPEGGISPEELATFDEVGARTVRVGDHVLRTSTAGVVALAALSSGLVSGAPATPKTYNSEVFSVSSPKPPAMDAASAGPHMVTREPTPDHSPSLHRFVATSKSKYVRLIAVLCVVYS